MKETTKYQIIALWIDACETKAELRKAKNSIENIFILDEDTTLDLIDLANKKIKELCK